MKSMNAAKIAILEMRFMIEFFLVNWTDGGFQAVYSKQVAVKTRAKRVPNSRRQTCSARCFCSHDQRQLRLQSAAISGDPTVSLRRPTLAADSSTTKRWHPHAGGEAVAGNTACWQHDSAPQMHNREAARTGLVVHP